jgi:PadR family transcriptional regulator PadR
MAPRHRPASLGEFELLVLLSTLSLGDDAYPVSVGRDIETRTRRKASRASVLITLERLEDKELVGPRRVRKCSLEPPGAPRRWRSAPRSALPAGRSR